MNDLKLETLGLLEAVKSIDKEKSYYLHKEDGVKLLKEDSDLFYVVENRLSLFKISNANRKECIFDKKDKNFGVVGEYTGYKNYHIGDVVSYYSGGVYKESLVVNNRNNYTVYGWGTDSIDSLEIRCNLRLVKKYFDVDSESLAKLQYKLYIK